MSLSFSKCFSCKYQYHLILVCKVFSIAVLFERLPSWTVYQYIHFRIASFRKTVALSASKPCLVCDYGESFLTKVLHLVSHILRSFRRNSLSLFGEGLTYDFLHIISSVVIDFYVNPVFMCLLIQKSNNNYQSCGLIVDLKTWYLTILFPLVYLRF